MTRGFVFSAASAAKSPILSPAELSGEKYYARFGFFLYKTARMENTKSTKEER